MLLESLQPGTVLWDSYCISMEKQNEGWRLHFKNGSSAHADIVIAADGANSKIRPYITDIKSFYTGVTMLEINIPDAAKTMPHIHALLDGGALMAFGKSQCLLGGLKDAADANFYASLKTDENWATISGLNFSDKKQMLEWFKKEYSGWSDV